MGVADFLGRANFLEAQVVGTHGDRVRVRLPAGVDLEVDRGDSTWRPVPDEAATLFIRPERVRLGGSADGSAVELPGTVQRHVFLGGIVRYVLDVGGGRPVLADAQRLLPGIEAGKPARVKLDLADIRAYPGTQRPWGDAA
jgi:ABC-type Fe3+/spermidine/putrescine transport system ATPase subunit